MTNPNTMPPNCWPSVIRWPTYSARLIVQATMRGLYAAARTLRSERAQERDQVITLRPRNNGQGPAVPCGRCCVNCGLNSGEGRPAVVRG